MEKRNNTIQEILITERNYVNVLTQIVQYFVEPLEKNSDLDESFISKADIRVLFSEIKVIWTLNMNFLKDLENVVKKSSQPISMSFTKYGELFRWYQLYICSYERSASTLKRLTKENLQFKEFIIATELRPELNRMDLSSLMIQPVQRIPQYIILLTDIAKHTSESHPDYTNSLKALKLMSVVGHYINEKKREAENIEQVISLSKQIVNFNMKSIPSRRFYLKDEFEVISDSIRGIKKVFVLGFSDMMLITQELGDTYQVLEYGYFKDKIEITNDKVLDQSCIFEIKMKNKSIQLASSSVKKKQMWEYHINRFNDIACKLNYQISKHAKRLKAISMNPNTRDLDSLTSMQSPRSLRFTNKRFDALKREDSTVSKLRKSIEMEVHKIIKNEGFSNIDAYIKALQITAHYIAPIENTSNLKTSKLSLILINRSFIIISEKGKIVSYMHILDITMIKSVSHPHLLIQSKDHTIEGISVFCDDIIRQIRKTFKLSFPGIPKKMSFVLDVEQWRISRISIQKDRILQGGFERTYLCVCDWLSHQPRGDVITDVSNFLDYEFDISKLKTLSIMDIRAITISLWYNCYFKSFKCQLLPLNKEALMCISDLLNQNSTFEKLVLNQNDISKDSLSIFQDGFHLVSKKLRSLEISHNPIEDKGIQFLAKYLDSQKECPIHTLVLKDTLIGIKGFIQLFFDLKRTTSTFYCLSTLDISENKLDADGSSALASYLSTPCAIKNLNISNTQARLSVIVESIVKGCVYLNRLDIHGNKIGKRDIPAFVNLMKKSESLIHLNISQTDIIGSDLAKLLGAISHNHYLSKMTILANQNQIGSIGAIELSSTLEDLRGIECLSLKDNDFTDEGVALICKSLKNKSCLKELYIDGNFKARNTKTRETLISSLSGLISSKFGSLRKLSMNHGGKSHSQLKQDIIPIIESLNRTKLIRIDISGHKMGTQGAYALSRVIRSSTTLKEIIWDENFIGIDGFEAVVNAFTDTATLTFLEIPVLDIANLISQDSDTYRIKHIVLQMQLFSSNTDTIQKDSVKKDSLKSTDIKVKKNKEKVSKSKDKKNSKLATRATDKKKSKNKSNILGNSKSSSSDISSQNDKASRRRSSSLTRRRNPFERIQSLSATDSLDLAEPKVKPFNKPIDRVIYTLPSIKIKDEDTLGYQKDDSDEESSQGSIESIDM